jgi:type II secretory pathway pseudopilin PulG
MTIFETAILAAVIGVLLFVIAGGIGVIRQQAKRNLCTRLMAQLSEALAEYQKKTGEYPPGAPDSSAGPAIAALEAVEPAAAALKPLPASLHIAEDPIIGCVDPWGEPLHYLTKTAPSEHDRREVAANGGIPIFESAGRDKDFGRDDPTRAADNVRTSDLR